jgi:hypothetical protein
MRVTGAPPPTHAARMSPTWIAGIELAAQLCLVIGALSLIAIAGAAALHRWRPVTGAFGYGLAAVVAAWIALADIRAQYALAGWIPASCTMISSQLDSAHVRRVAYQYQVDGDARVGLDYRLGDDGDGPPLDAAERAALAPGARRTCYVDPGDASRAVLDAAPVWRPRLGAIALFALAMLLMAVRRMRAAWRHLAIWRRLRAAAAAMPRAVARGRRRNGQGPR